MKFLGITLIIPLLLAQGLRGTPTDLLQGNAVNNGSEQGISKGLPEEIINQLRRMAGMASEIASQQMPKEGTHLTEANHEVSPASPATASDVATITAAYEPLFQSLLQSLLNAEIHRIQLQEEVRKLEEELTKERKKFMENCPCPGHPRQPGHLPQPPSHPRSQPPPGTLPVDMEESEALDQNIQKTILKAVWDIKENMIGCERLPKDSERQKNGWPTDCYDLFRNGIKESGPYTIYPKMLNRPEGVRVWCDMGEGWAADEAERETKDGGWTVIIKRQPLPEQVNFTRMWSGYKRGFGLAETEYWIGNDVMHALTTGGRPQMLKVMIQDWDNSTSFAVYNTFSVGDEASQYQLSVAEFDATSTVRDVELKYHHTMKFTTPDVDNDTDDGKNCAQHFGGSFWYNACYRVNPTSRLLPKEESDDYDTSGIEWGQIDEKWVNRKAMSFMLHPRN